MARRPQWAVPLALLAVAALCSCAKGEELLDAEGCGKYLTEWGAIPGVTWGKTPEADQALHQKSDCDGSGKMCEFMRSHWGAKSGEDLGDLPEDLAGSWTNFLNCDAYFASKAADAPKPCARPFDGAWCSHEGATFSDKVDCDDDGVADLTCFDTDGHRAILLAKDCSASDHWPDAPVSSCLAVFDPEHAAGAPKPKPCARPGGNWCSHEGATFSDKVDCDDDGVADLTCIDTGGNRAILLAKDCSASDHWPDAPVNLCPAVFDPALDAEGCGKYVTEWKAIPGVTWGDTPEEAQAQYLSDCNKSGKLCEFMRSHWGAKSGEDLGDLPEELAGSWTDPLDCDTYFSSKEPEAGDSPTGSSPTGDSPTGESPTGSSPSGDPSDGLLDAEGCGKYLTEWGAIPGVTWGNTTEEAQALHLKSDCDGSGKMCEFMRSHWDAQNSTDLGDLPEELAGSWTDVLKCDAYFASKEAEGDDGKEEVVCAAWECPPAPEGFYLFGDGRDRPEANLLDPTCLEGLDQVAEVEAQCREHEACRGYALSSDPSKAADGCALSAALKDSLTPTEFVDSPRTCVYGKLELVQFAPTARLVVELRTQTVNDAPVPYARCFTLVGDDLAKEGEVVVQERCSGKDTQKWYLEAAGDTPACFKARVGGQVDGLCLTVPGASPWENGNQLTVAACGEGAEGNDVFCFKQKTDNSADGYLMNHPSDADQAKCLDISMGSVSDGEKVQVWDCNGSEAQAFHLGRPLPDWSVQKSGAVAQSPSCSYSRSMRFRLCLLADGNVALYDRAAGSTATALWTTDTAQADPAAGAPYTLLNDASGNLILSNAAGDELWSSGTADKGPASLVLLDDGNVVLQADTEGKEVIWETKTGLEYYAERKATLEACANGSPAGGEAPAPAPSGGPQERPKPTFPAPRSPNKFYGKVDHLVSGECLVTQDPVDKTKTGKSCVAGDGVSLCIHLDGNVVLEDDAGKALWQSKEGGYLYISQPITLCLGADGDLVAHESTQMLWQAKMGGKGPGTLQINKDGAAAIVNWDGRPVWTAPASAITLPTLSEYELLSDPSYESLKTGQCLSVAKNDFTGRMEQSCVASAEGGKVTFCLQADGNIVVSEGGWQKWASDTQHGDLRGGENWRLCLQPDGNLVAYDRLNTVYWSTGTNVETDARSKLLLRVEGHNAGMFYQDDDTMFWSTSGVTDAWKPLQILQIGNQYGRLKAGQCLTTLRSEQSCIADAAGKISFCISIDGKVYLNRWGGKMWSSDTGSNAQPYTLCNKYDGNLVANDASGATLWSSGTAGKGPATLFIDGLNAVLEGNEERSVNWMTGIPDPRPPPPLPPSPWPAAGTESEFFYGEKYGSLAAGQCLVTKNKDSGVVADACLVINSGRMCIKKDGNVWYFRGTSVQWETATSLGEAKGPFKLCVQWDGDVVASDGSGESYWSSGTAGKGPGVKLSVSENPEYKAVIRESVNGALVVYWKKPEST